MFDRISTGVLTEDFCEHLEQVRTEESMYTGKNRTGEAVSLES